jgi:hypothetical protein
LAAIDPGVEITPFPGLGNDWGERESINLHSQTGKASPSHGLSARWKFATRDPSEVRMSIVIPSIL